MDGVSAYYIVRPVADIPAVVNTVHNPSIWPVLVYGGIVALIAVAMLVLSYALGERHRSRERNEPYESGIVPTGSSRLRYDAKYYLVGLFFILFDVEVAFILAWAVAFRELSWAGYIEILLFVAVLVAGLVYIWRLGGLDVYRTPRRLTKEIASEHQTNAE